jgi:molybdopterin-guanine dinucleotide biosynthesis protein B
MAHIIGFCGTSQSGKTTLVEKVIPRLTREGLKIAVIKHHGHDAPLEYTDAAKDSRRLARAGAKNVLLSHPGGALIETDAAPQNPKQLATWNLPVVDLVLVEGFKLAEIDKIEVVAPDRQPVLPQGGRLLAITRRGGSGLECGLPVLDADNPALVADFVRRWLKGQENRGPRVHIKVDGQELSLKPFVANLIEANIRGMAKGLKGAESARRIEVLLD